MSENVYGIRGEFRRFTPREIGLFIRDCRERMGLKRIALATDAGLTEKTLERAEAGKGVSEDSCRRIATALGLGPESFTGKMFIPDATTSEELEHNARRLKEQWERTHSAVAVQELRSIKDVIPFFGTCGLLGDDHYVAEEHLGEFAALKQLVIDWGDVASDLPEAERIAAAKTVVQSVREFEAFGYVVKGAVIERYVIGGPNPNRPSKWPMTFLVAFRKPKGTKDTTPAEAWVPKKTPLSAQAS